MATKEPGLVDLSDGHGLYDRDMKSFTCFIPDLGRLKEVISIQILQNVSVELETASEIWEATSASESEVSR